MGKVDWTGIATSGVGSRTLIFNFTLRSNSVGFMFSEPSIYPPAPLLQARFLVASCELKNLAGEGICMPQPRGVIDTVGIAEIEQLQPNDTDQTDEQHGEQAVIPRAHL